MKIHRLVENTGLSLPGRQRPAIVGKVLRRARELECYLTLGVDSYIISVYEPHRLKKTKELADMLTKGGFSISTTVRNEEDNDSPLTLSGVANFCRVIDAGASGIFVRLGNDDIIVNDFARPTTAFFIISANKYDQPVGM